MAFSYARPDADSADGGWSNQAGSQTNLYASIDETIADDADYISSSPGNNNDIVKLSLSDVSSVSNPTTVRYRYKKNDGGDPAPVNMQASLLQGSTIIAQWQHNDIGTSYTLAEQSLTSDQFSAISDLTNLFLQFQTTWWLADASVDLWFTNAQYYDSSDPTVAVTDFLSCSRASIGYAKNADGTLTQFGNDTLRITDLGLLVEDSRTNVVLWNRDLTNILWVAVNITAAKDQTGPDGVGNSASSITATAGNGTILQTTVIASSARYQSAWVKRITGTGTINMTMDNGSTWTAVTVTSSWTLVENPTQTLSNPIVGFQIVTSGDAIAVDFVQNENGIFVSSPIATTTTSATRAQDVVTCIGNLATVLKGSAMSAVADAILSNGFPSGLTPQLLNTSDLFYVLYGVSSVGQYSQIRTFDGAVELDATLGSGGLLTAGAKVGLSGDASNRSVVGGGGTVVTDANDLPALTNNVYLMHQGGGDPNTQWWGSCRRLTVWNSRLADAILQALTAP